jgi:hypothetical protein
MRRIKISLISIFVACLLLLPSIAWPQSQEMASDLPQVAQPLVREGDFAIKLAEALKMGTAEDEDQAENVLVTAGIEPRNGWISDYPVTPDVIGELQKSIIGAADSGKLTTTKDEAVQDFQSLCTSLGLPTVADTSGTYPESESGTEANQYNSPTVVNNYYYDYGPPIITYYPPPWDYYYLYAWVPYPFWYGRFYFAGFFCLHNFNKIVVVNHRHRFVTNQVFNSRLHRAVRIDPSTRSSGRFNRSEKISSQSGFASTQARTGAQGILTRSFERTGLSQAAPSPRRADLPERNLSSTGVDRRLQEATPQREFGRLPDSPRRDFGSPASANRSEAIGRHDWSSPQEVRGSMGSFGNQGSSRDLVGGANTSRSEGSGRESRFSIGNSVGSSPSREIRGGGREGSFHGGGRSAGDGRGACVGRC